MKFSVKKTKSVAWTPAVDISPCSLAPYYLSWARYISAITPVLQDALGSLKLTLWNIGGEMLQVQGAGRDPAASWHQPRILKSFVHYPSVIKLFPLEAETLFSLAGTLFHLQRTCCNEKETIICYDSIGRVIAALLLSESTASAVCVTGWQDTRHFCNQKDSPLRLLASLKASDVSSPYHTASHVAL